MSSTNVTVQVSTATRVIVRPSSSVVVRPQSPRVVVQGVSGPTGLGIGDGTVVIVKDGAVIRAVNSATGAVVASGVAGTSDAVPGDDAAVITAADAAVATGGRVVFGPHIYYIATTVVHSPVTVWEGTGNNPTTGQVGAVLRCMTTGAAVTVNNSGSLVNMRGQIRNMRITYAGALTTGTKGVQITGTQDFIIENCYIGNFARNVEATDMAALYVDRCYLFGSKEVGLYLNDTSDCWVINSQVSGALYGLHAIASSSISLIGSRPQASGQSNVRVESTGFFGMTGGFSDSADISVAPGDKHGIELVDVDSARITGVQFYANGTDADIVIDAGASLTMQSVSIVGCIFNTGNVGKAAIRIPALAGTLKRVSIVGNVVDNDDTVLIAVADPGVAPGAENMTIVGNTALGGMTGLRYVKNISTSGNTNFDDPGWALKTGSFHTLTQNERRVRAAPSSGDQQIVLPSAADRYNGMRVIVKKSTATTSVITVTGNGANIDEGTLTLTSPYESVTVEWDQNLGRWHSIGSVNRQLIVPANIPLTAAAYNLTTSLVTVTSSSLMVRQSDFLIPPDMDLECRIVCTFAGHTSGDVLEVEGFNAETSSVVIANTALTTTSANTSKITTGWTAVPATPWRGNLRARNATAARGQTRAAWLEFRYV